jgi:hypothetical protein
MKKPLHASLFLIRIILHMTVIEKSGINIKIKMTETFKKSSKVKIKRYMSACNKLTIIDKNSSSIRKLRPNGRRSMTTKTSALLSPRSPRNPTEAKDQIAPAAEARFRGLPT